MIRSFRDHQAAKLFDRERSRAVPAALARAALRKLLMLDAAESLADLRTPSGNRLERLKGDRDGQYSIRINDQYRICFTWKDSNAEDVEITKHYD